MSSKAIQQHFGMCSSHNPSEETNRVKWYEWAEKQEGRQKQCEKCKFWFFDVEF